MLTIESPRTNHLELTLSGRLTEPAMAEALDAFVELSRDMTHGTMLYTITNFEIPELGAIAVELRRMPALLRTIFAFDRCAVLCETPWIKVVAELEGLLIPGLAIKSFALTEREAAEAWLQES